MINTMNRIRQQGAGASFIRLIICAVLIANLMSCSSSFKSNQPVIEEKKVILTPKPGPKTRRCVRPYFPPEGNPIGIASETKHIAMLGHIQYPKCE